MASITQDMRYRLSLIKYAEKYGVSKAAIKYKPTGSTFTDGNGALTAPLGLFAASPEGRTITLTRLSLFLTCAGILHADLVVFWVKLMQRDYSRSLTSLYCFLKKQGIMAVHPPNPKYILKPYEQMNHPSQRI